MCFVIALISLALSYNFFINDMQLESFGSLIVAIIFIVLMLRNIMYVKKTKKQKKEKQDDS